MSTQPTQEDVDANVPLSYRGIAFDDLPGGLQRRVERALMLEEEAP